MSRSVPPLVWAAIRRGRWLGTLGAAIAAYVVVQIIEVAGYVAVSRLFAPGPVVYAVVSLAVGLSAMVLGGYVATWIRRGAAVAFAVIVGVVVVALMATGGKNAPLWYQIGFLAMGPLASLAGGATRWWRRS